MKLFRLATRLRYWKRRALAAEQAVVTMQAYCDSQVSEARLREEAERWRNVEREDMFVSAAILGSRGMIGIPPRSGPALKPVSQQRLLTTPDPWDAVTGAEKMEYETFYRPDGLAMGLTEIQIRQRFMQDLAQRKALNDKPSM